MTIARNLTTDHYQSGRNRLEMTTEDMSPHDSATEGPESAVLASLTNEALMAALRQLPSEQQECLVMRFLQGMSIAETAQVMGRSDGAISSCSCGPCATWPSSCRRACDEPPGPEDERHFCPSLRPRD
jgi:RNA polymerase sigma factor (sigma-70 family)